jgi:feruloyl-CoA synthase
MDIETVPYRNAATFAPRRIEVIERADGCLTLQSPLKLNPLSRSVCDYLPRWAKEASDRAFLAERTVSRDWRTLTYGQAWNATRSLGEALLALGAEPGDRIAILSVARSIMHC